MNVRKGAVGTACAVAMAASLGMFGAVAYAADDYAPTTLGNDAYSNQVDKLNDITVEGASYVGSISSQNTDLLALAESQSTTMGTKSEGATAVLLTNETGTSVTSLAVQRSDQTTAASNGLSGSLADGSAACWWVEAAYYESSYTDSVDRDWTVAVNYNLVATLDGGTTAVFHNVNMNGVRSLTLKYSEEYGVYYVERTTITNHTPDPTLQYEVNLKAYGNDEEYNFHVNSSAALSTREYTESRGSAWDDEHSHDIIASYWNAWPVYVPLFGEPSDDYTDGVYAPLYWNAEQLKWRAFGFED